MKNILTMLSLAVLLILGACSKESTTPTGSTDKVTITLNSGINNIQISPFIDTIELQVNATCTGSLTVSKIYVLRSVNSVPGVIDSVFNGTFTTGTVNQTYYDIRTVTNLETLSENDIVTYAVNVYDNKGSVTTQSINFVVKSLFTSGSQPILIGAPMNTTNNFKFLGTFNNFQRYSAGADSSGTNYPARFHSDKVDFVFYTNISDATVGAAIYSPDYPFATGTGWNAEINTWTTKNHTIYMNLTDFSLSNFDQDLQCVNKLKDLDFSTATNALKRISGQQVIAFKTHDGRKGLMLFSDVPASNSTQFQVKIKMEP